MRRLTALALVLFVLLNCAFTVCAADKDSPVDDELTEEYTNAKVVTVSLSINNSGTASIGIVCTGLAGTTNISAVTYLEKWNGATWVRAYINNSSQVTASQNGSQLVRTYTTAVSSGKYRATTVFTVTKGTTETITQRSSTAVY